MAETNDEASDKAIGEVMAILNEDYLLVRSKHPVSPRTVLVVFETVRHEKLRALGLDFLDFPKGKIAIVSGQKEGVYLYDSRARDVPLGERAR